LAFQNNYFIKIEYKIEGDTSWSEIDSAIGPNLGGAVELKEYSQRLGLRGKRIKFRLSATLPSVLIDNISLVYEAKKLK
jgi:hypothetical protein